MKKLNGYYYCFSQDQYSHELYSVVGITLQEIKKVAAGKGTRLYLVRYKRYTAGKKEKNTCYIMVEPTKR